MDDPIRAFHDLIDTADEALDLGRAALMVATIECPDLEPATWRARLDDIADRSGAANLPDADDRLERLRRFLFEVEGFRGNAEHYFDPLNSCLNAVIERKRGIPITLSVLMMEIGRRVGVPIEGVGLPGHFVVRARRRERELLIDPFNGGATLTDATVRDVVARALGREMPLTPEHLAAVSKRRIITRMLLNLKMIYIERERWDKALAVMDRLLAIEPRSPFHARDRGTVLMKLGDFHHGVAEWERALSYQVSATDTPELRQQLSRIRQALASLN